MFNLQFFRFLLSSFFLTCGITAFSWTGTANIDATTNQYIRGFGTCSAWYESTYLSQLATWYWDTTGLTGNNPNKFNNAVLSISGSGNRIK